MKQVMSMKLEYHTVLELIRIFELLEETFSAKIADLGWSVLVDEIALLFPSELPGLHDHDVIVANPKLSLEPSWDSADPGLGVKAANAHA